MPRAGLTRASVVDEAADLVDGMGLESLTLATLARRLGVQPPSLYSHIASLDDVRLELRLRGLRMLVDEVRRRGTGRSGVEAIGAMCTAFRAVATAHPGMYAATVPAGQQDPPEVAAATADLLGVAIDVLRGSAVPDDRLIDAARFVRSAVHGFVSLEGAGGFGLPDDLDRSFEWLVDAVVAGVVRSV